MFLSEIMDNFTTTGLNTILQDLIFADNNCSNFSLNFLIANTTSIPSTGEFILYLLTVPYCSTYVVSTVDSRKKIDEIKCRATWLFKFSRYFQT